MSPDGKSEVNSLSKKGSKKDDGKSTAQLLGEAKALNNKKVKGASSIRNLIRSAHTRDK